jgi:hypothetical protein
MKLSGKPWIMNEGRSSRPNPQRMLQASGPQHPDCSFYRGLLQAPAGVGRGDFVPCRWFNVVAASLVVTGFAPGAPDGYHEVVREALDNE